MATQPIRVSIGRQRLHSAVEAGRPSEAGYARDIREQMRVIRENLKKVINNVDGVMAEALVFGLKPIFDESQVLVPVKTGRLKRSGFLRSVKTSTGAAAEIGYAKGGRPFYAGFVHERIWVFHAPPTQAKYLEEAVNRHLNELQPRIVDYIQAQTGIST